MNVPASRAVTVARIAAIAWLSAAQLAPAQGLDEGAVQQRRDRLEAPELPRQTAPAFKLPPLPPPGSDAPLSELLTVFVRAIQIEGNTVLPEAQLREKTQPYTGREITSAELEELRRALTALYVSAGYATSGVVIPDQDVADGEITLRVIEGILADVQVTGLDRLKPAFVRDRLIARSSGVLNVPDLQEQLQLLNQHPLIAQVNGRLEPGLRLGESILLLEVTEDRPYEMDLTVDNESPPSVGSIKGTVRAAHRNVTGRGDVAQIEFSRTVGQYDLDVSYFVPVTAYDTRVGVRYERGKSNVVERPFNLIDVESESEGAELRVEQPIVSTLDRTVSAALAFNLRKTRTFLRGRPTGLSPGVGTDGRSKVSVLRIIGDWVERSSDQVVAIRSTVSVGLDAFGATDNRSAADGQFVTWLGQAQWVRRFGQNQNQVVARADVQLADDALLPLEKFAVGGATSVRGYRENELVRDNGWAASLELRVPVLHNEAGLSNTQVAAFFDAGRSWNRTDGSPDPRFISSAGLGLRWDPIPKLHTELYWARAFRNVDQSSDDLQDDGVHFLLRYSVF